MERGWVVHEGATRQRCGRRGAVATNAGRPPLLYAHMIRKTRGRTVEAEAEAEAEAARPTAGCVETSRCARRLPSRDRRRASAASTLLARHCQR